jgi:ATP-binding cassette, subfamily B, bacterial
VTFAAFFCFPKIQDDKMKIPLRKYWALLRTYLPSQWPRMAILALLLTLGIVLRLYNPRIIARFIDQAFAGAPLTSLLTHGATYFAIAAAIQVLVVINVYISEHVAWTATNALRLDLLRHLLALDMPFHKAHTPGELTERIDSDVDALSNFFSRFVVNVVGNGILSLGVLVLMYRQHWLLGVGFTLFAIGGLSALMRLQAMTVPYYAKLHEVRAQFYGFVGEQFEGTEDIRANGGQGHVMRRFYQHLRGWLPAARNSSLAGYSGWMTNAALIAIGTALGFGMTVHLWDRGAITLGTIYLVLDYLGLLFGQIVELRWQIMDLQHAEAGMGRIQQLFDLRSKITEGDLVLPQGPLSVTFHNVSFAYDDAVTAPVPDNGGDDGIVAQLGEHASAESDGRVLQGLDFRLAPGRVLGLLGRTGSGKTTLARLLLRLYDPCEGQVWLGDTSLTKVKVAELRRRVALVTQEVQLFQASVRDNLTLFNPDITDDAILPVLHDLGLLPWLGGLPDGLDTELSAGGSGLSAGQAQLLAFARVFLANPDLVIMDEASSRLDPATEQLIERAVDLLLRNRTGIVIAHRLNTIQRADDILILEEGRIREMGERAQLAADPSSHLHYLLRTGMQEVLA